MVVVSDADVWFTSHLIQNPPYVDHHHLLILLILLILSLKAYIYSEYLSGWTTWQSQVQCVTTAAHYVVFVRCWRPSFSINSVCLKGNQCIKQRHCVRHSSPFILSPCPFITHNASQTKTVCRWAGDTGHCHGFYFKLFFSAHCPQPSLERRWWKRRKKAGPH